MKSVAVGALCGALAAGAVVDWSATSDRASVETTLEGVPLKRLVRSAGDHSVWLAGNYYLPAFGDNPMRFDTYVSRISPDGRTLFTTYLRGSFPTGLALDREGNAVVAGQFSGTPLFTPTPGALRADNPAGFVAKISPQGTILFAAHLAAKPLALAVDAEAAPYITGTADPNFRPTPGAFKTGIGPKDCWPRHSAEPVACSDAFAAKLRPDGAALVYATFLGGRREERGAGIAVDASGAAYITGETRSDDFPVTPNAFQRAYGGTVELGPLSFGDVFVTKLDPTGRSLLYSTFLGGHGVEQPGDIALDAQGRMVITGSTQSEDFPVSPDAPQRQYGGGLAMPGATSDAFVVRLNERGERMWATYFGRDTGESAGAVVIGPNGRIYVNVTGPVRAVLENRRGGACEPASGVLVLDPATGRILTHFAQWPLSGLLGLDVDASGRAYIAAGPATGQFGPLSGFAYTRVLRIDFDKDADVLPECIVNAASLLPGPAGRGSSSILSPGEIVSIVGEKLGPAEPRSATVNLPAELGGTRVLIDGRPAALLYVHERQINAVIPFETPPGTAVVTVERNRVRSDPGSTTVERAAPALFTVPDSQGQAAALNQDATLNSASNPAPRGSVISVFGTGFGAMAPQPGSFSLTPLTPPWPEVAERMEAYIAAPVEGGAAGMEILYAGAAPGLAPGTVQVNLRIPASAGRGRVPIKLLLYRQPSVYERTQDGVFVYIE